ncbi:MAG: hypothetical protein Q4G68_10795 [Planctomycetia bacterium]|nr:hypothetical protein [Planctomycetia bacterium]
MASQLLSAFKYGILAAVAFVGPQVITDSGDWLGNVHAPHVGNESAPRLKTSEYREVSIPARSPVARRLAEGTIGPVAARPVTTRLAERPESWTQAWKETRVRSDLSRAVLPGRNPVVPLEEVIRFDRSPEWILATWPRVDTVRGHDPFFGYRVALLTGPESDDLTGVLTYYYDNTQLQEIVFSGQTGDYHRLLHFLESRYGMAPARATSADRMAFVSTIASRRPGSHEVSKLTIQPSQTYFSDHKENFYDVSFTLHRP